MFNCIIAEYLSYLLFNQLYYWISYRYQKFFKILYRYRIKIKILISQSTSWGALLRDVGILVRCVKPLVTFEGSPTEKQLMAEKDQS